MDGFRSQSPKPWSNTTDAGALESTDQDAPWKNFGSSLNALSFGFVATAILISMFLIMAIFEHLLRPRMALSRNAANRSLGSAPRTQMHLLEKLGHSSTYEMTTKGGEQVVRGACVGCQDGHPESSPTRAILLPDIYHGASSLPGGFFSFDARAADSNFHSSASSSSLSKRRCFLALS
ncbi:uncharacterized protein LOC116257047 [Nymphaea colorata]|uniref:uncharacterized protein LOC116257047 n=1 Tax=Nymphaea colorata TaxID=210225 RepID=UPI00129EDA1F|nr:uncharacterized protein LOC116257047 [Nymphaea colorata]XP_031489514.1 uncharacterized protein LOC116257047 [Nymphaea colorata]XP_031489515.1 uncharacterized protein LOC116257047 [Nymphaea colorata]XP_031489516.1 uncharacterized protein LOC116257047 [Nymphaea colorata]XP_031489519.1 uncharacterized protein LOC116257047 [Nymphaea colorata]XP_049934881.1 uncharacterized protein LOC116257047 [Nymphaea colorata]XP_049934882.1 uncharacterized protein LOC116257047 [Nymphaea colorata]XP_04993488